MKIEIHDVGHGGCAVVTCPNGTRVMLDCGFDAGRGWFPSIAYAGEYIDLIVLQNLDEDHVEDLPHVLRKIKIGSLFSNPTVTASALASMKRKDGMREGVQAAYSVLCDCGSGLVGRIGDGGEVNAWSWWNIYDLDFADTNNLSVVTFVRWGAFTILFAGDLEKAGWRSLLRNPFFAVDLSTVTVLVASHHGRANGRCDEVFNIVRPEIVIFSDDRKQYETQETDGWYRQRVQGIPVLDGKPSGFVPRRRHVLTTRRDGSLTIRVNRYGGYLVTPSRDDPQPLSSLLSLFGNAA